MHFLKTLRSCLEANRWTEIVHQGERKMIAPHALLYDCDGHLAIVGRRHNHKKRLRLMIAEITDIAAQEHTFTPDASFKRAAYERDGYRLVCSV